MAGKKTAVEREKDRKSIKCRQRFDNWAGWPTVQSSDQAPMRVPRPEPAVGEGWEVHRSGAIPIHLLPQHCLICVPFWPVAHSNSRACPDPVEGGRKEAQRERGFSRR
jgi:hypothetical protein